MSQVSSERNRRDARILIERGVPIPPLRKPMRYPWAELREIGDSFLVPEPDLAERRRRMRRLCASIPWQTRRTGRRYIVRMVAGGVRCWLADIPRTGG